MLERLENIEVGTFAFRKAILAVELEFRGDDRVLTPAVHVESSLTEDECTRIRDTRVVVAICNGVTSPTSRNFGHIHGIRSLEHTRGVDELIDAGGGLGSTEGIESIRQSINRISIVERLGTESLEENTVVVERRSVIDVRIRLDNPDDFLARVIEIELDLVG